jgi:hypothetical protein
MGHWLFFFQKSMKLTSSKVMSVTAERQDQPKAYYEVPSLQVSKYVKRLQLLKDIGTSFADSMESAFHPRRVVLLGMGGQGKTQLALEYCHMARTSETYQAIFWIDAYLLLLSPKGLKQSLQRFLTRDVCSLVSRQRWNSSKTHLEGGEDRGLWYSTIMTILIDSRISQPISLKGRLVQYFSQVDMLVLNALALS